MKRLLIVSLLFLSCPWFTRASEVAEPVYLSEIAWAGSSVSTADEWLEVCGPPGTDLSGWTIEGASANPLVLPEGSAIPESGAFVISNYSAEDPKSSLAAAPNFVTTAVALSNSALRLTLHDPNSAQVDEAGTAETAPPAGTSGSTKSSMERVMPLSNEDLAEAWSTATTSQGFDPGATELGTPGSCPAMAEEGPAEEEPTPEPEEETPPPEEDPPLELPPEASPAAPAEEPAPADAAPTESGTATPATDPMPAPETPADTASEDSPPLQAPALPAATPPTTAVRISEAYPAPKTGEKEWIELVNRSSVGEVLDGWTVADGKGTPTKLSGVLLPWARLVIEAPRGSLNNDGDLVVLKDAQERVIDGVSYGVWETPTHPRVAEIKKGWSLIRLELQDIFDVTTTPTKEASNVLTRPAAAETIHAPAPEAASAPSLQKKEVAKSSEVAPVKVPLAPKPAAPSARTALPAAAARVEAKTPPKRPVAAKATKTKKPAAKKPAAKYKGEPHEGTIAVPPGIYSKTKMYVLNEAGLQEVRLSKSGKGLASGERIAFIAQEKEEDGSSFLSANPNSIRRLDASASTTFATIEQWPGAPGAYRFEAEVVSAKSGGLEVRLGGSEGDVLLPPKMPGLQPGDLISLEGFITPGARPQVVLASKEALRLIKAASSGSGAAASVLSNRQGDGSRLPWPAAAGLTLAVGGAGTAAYLRNERMKRSALAGQLLEEEST